MNLEMEFIKKEMETLKQAVQSLRTEIENEKKYIGFKLIYKQTMDTPNYTVKDILPQILDPTNYKIQYTIRSHEDSTFRSSLMPDLRVFYITLTLYVECTSLTLLETFTSQLKTQPRYIKPFKTIELMKDAILDEPMYPRPL